MLELTTTAGHALVYAGFVYDNVAPVVSEATVRDGFVHDIDMDGGIGDLSFQASDNLIKANFGCVCSFTLTASALSSSLTRHFFLMHRRMLGHHWQRLH